MTSKFEEKLNAIVECAKKQKIVESKETLEILINEFLTETNEVVNAVCYEVDDSISFMELFPLDSLGDENRITDKENALKRKSAYFN